MKKLLLFAVLAIPAFPQFFGGSNASKIRGINVLGPLTVSDGCALVYVAASTRFECGAGSGGGTGNGIVAVTVSAATSATLTHNAALATPYIVPFACREDTTNLPVIPATTTFTTNAIAFTFSPAFTGKCAASTGGSGISGSIATGQICYGSASNTCAGSNNLFWDSATNRQGINTATPVTELQVSSTSTSSPRGIMSAQFSTGTDGARFHGRKARGTEAAPTVIVSGDNLTRWVGSGYDGSNYLEDASIIFGTEGTIAATRIPTNIQFLTATDAAPSVLTERMRITAAGFVGIGTTPVSPLDVSLSNAAAGLLKIKNTSATGFSSFDTYTSADVLAGGFGYGNASAAAFAGKMYLYTATKDLQFSYNSGTTVAGVMLSTGIWGFGKGNTSPTGTMHVYDATASTGATTLTVKAGAGQSSTNLQEWQNNAGTVLASVSSIGALTTAGQVVGGNINLSDSGAYYWNTRSVLKSPADGTVTFSNNAVTASQVTLQMYTDTSLSRIGAGIVGVGTGAAGSVAGEMRGGISDFVTVRVNGSNALGATTIAGQSAISLASSFSSLVLNAGSSTPIIGIGGTSSAHPALKRSTTGIVARLADDSADTWFQASQFRSTLTTPASAAATCTAGTIVADTGFVYVCTATDTWKRVAIATW